MASKTLTTVAIVFACIIILPIGIGIVGGLFGLVMGIFGAVFGLIAGIFGGIVGAIGWLFASLFNWGWHPMNFHYDFTTIVIIILIIVLISKSRGTSKK